MANTLSRRNDARVTETALLFQTAEPDTSASQKERFLERVAADPGRTLAQIFKSCDQTGSDDAVQHAIDHHEPVAVLSYHTARLLSPKGRAEDCVGTAELTGALAKPGTNADLVRAAAQSALAELQPKIRRGKGGSRRSTGTYARDLMIDHILDVYSSITGTMPGFTNFNGIGGPAVNYLRYVLPRAGFAVPSDSTLRRRISSFREREKSANIDMGILGHTFA
jgi:hypothetical protein